jgi:uncharacterized membrane protein
MNWRPDDEDDIDERPSSQPSATRRSRSETRRRSSARFLHRLLAGLLVPIGVVTLAGLVLLWPDGSLPKVGEGLSAPPNQWNATIQSSRAKPCQGTQIADGIVCQAVEADLTSGPRKGSRVSFEMPATRDTPTLEPGAPVILGFTADAGEGNQYVLLDFQRDRPLLLLTGLFVLVVLALGRWKGIGALAGLAASLGVIIVFVLPAILTGSSPLLVALTGAAVIAFIALFSTHGFTVPTSVALLGTLSSLALSGLLASIFVGATRLTGLSDEDALLLQVGDAQLNLRGLLLAGIVLGTLGVLDDVTVTQVSAVWELRRANPGWGAQELYRSALSVGRDHIASTVNTLVLAYAGASLPLLLFFRQATRSLTIVLTSEVVAIEIVRTLVGSIGLVASVPITTALAAAVAARTDPAQVDQATAHHH